MGLRQVGEQVELEATGQPVGGQHEHHRAAALDGVEEHPAAGDAERLGVGGVDQREMPQQRVGQRYLDAARRAGQHRLVVDGAGAVGVRLPCPGQVGAEVAAVTVLDDEEAARRHVDHRADAAEQGADDRAATAAVRADGDHGQRLVGHRVEERLPQGDPSRPWHLAAGRSRGHAGLIQPIECWRTHRRALLVPQRPACSGGQRNATPEVTLGRQEERYSTDIPVGTQLQTVTGSTHHHYSLYAARMGPWSFVGRAAELNRLIAAATDEGARGLIYSGTAGIGKSRLLREGVAALDTDRYAVWGASANIATAGLPFGGLAQVLPADQPAGLSPAGLLRWAVEALHQQAAGRPIVLAIDDVHLLDAVLGRAGLPGGPLRAAPRSSARCAAASRSRCRSAHCGRTIWSTSSSSPRWPSTTSPTCSPRCSTARSTAPSAERLWRLSAGNALLLRELVIAAHAGGEMIQSFGVWRWTGRLELAPSLTELIDARIGAAQPRRPHGRRAGRPR